MMSRKKGMTLIELIVAITLFTIVVTLAIGGFVAVSKMKTLMLDMKNTQQKVRLIYESIYREAKEANVVTVSPDGNKLSLKYLDDTNTLEEEKIFEVASDLKALKYYSCSGSTDHYGAGDYASSTDCKVENLLSATTTSVYQVKKVGTVPANFFVFLPSVPPVLHVQMTVDNISSTNDREITLENKIILESVK